MSLLFNASINALPMKGSRLMRSRQIKRFDILTAEMFGTTSVLRHLDLRHNTTLPDSLMGIVRSASEILILKALASQSWSNGRKIIAGIVSNAGTSLLYKW